MNKNKLKELSKTFDELLITEEEDELRVLMNFADNIRAIAYDKIQELKKKQIKEQLKVINKACIKLSDLSADELLIANKDIFLTWQEISEAIIKTFTYSSL